MLNDSLLGEYFRKLSRIFMNSNAHCNYSRAAPTWVKNLMDFKKIEKKNCIFENHMNSREIFEVLKSVNSIGNCRPGLVHYKNSVLS